MVVQDNPSLVRSIYAVCFAVLLHMTSSVLWIVSLSSPYWSRGAYSFIERSREPVHTVGVWKTCVTNILYEPYDKIWYAEDGGCWATSRYLSDLRIELSSILSFVSCMFVAVVLALYGLLYTASTWRPFLQQSAIPCCKVIQLLVSLAMFLVFTDVTDVGYNERLWARTLGMATVGLMGFEVVVCMCVGCSGRGLRDLCVDFSVYISDCGRDFPGPAHLPRAGTTVIGNPNSPAPPTTTGTHSCATAPHQVEEEPTAKFSPSGRRSGTAQNQRSLLNLNIFGRAGPAAPRTKRRLQLSVQPYNAKIPRVSTETPEHDTKPRIIVGKTQQLSDVSRKLPDKLQQHDCEVSVQSVSVQSVSVQSSSMSNRKLPKPPVTPVKPVKISNEVTVEVEQRPKPKEKHIQFQIESV